MEDHKNNERRIARLLREVVDHRELRPIGKYERGERGITVRETIHLRRIALVLTSLQPLPSYHIFLISHLFFALS